MKQSGEGLTELFEHLVTLVKDKVLDLGSVELLVTDKCHHTTGGSDNDVRALFLVGKDFLVGRDGCSTVEHRGAHIGHVLGETSKLVADLVGEFTSVAENDDGNLAINRLADKSALALQAFRTYICCKEARTNTAVLPIPDLA